MAPEFLTRFLGEIAESCNPVWWSTAENPQWKWEERAGSIDPEHRLRSNRGLWDSLWKVNGRVSGFWSILRLKLS